MRPIILTPEHANYAGSPITSTRQNVGQSQYDTNISPDNENFLNEQRAQRQSLIDKSANGLFNFGSTVLTSASENIVGLPFGFINAMVEQDASKLYDNAFTQNIIDPINNWSRENMPFYSSEKEKEASVLGGMAYQNFWFDKVFNGVGYTVGAMTSGIGLSKVLKLGKLASTGKLTMGAEEVLGNVGAKSIINKDAAKELYIGLTMAHGESSQEARDTYNQMKEMGYSDSEAESAANKNYVTNLFITGATDYALLRKTFKPGYKEGVEMNAVRSVENKTAKGLPAILEDATLNDKNRYLKGKALAFLESMGEEGGQEGAQFASNKLWSKYTELENDPKTKGNADNFINALTGALSDTFGSKEGLESMLIGSITGGPFGLRGAKAEMVQREELTKKYVDAINADPEFKNLLYHNIDSNTKEKLKLGEAVRALAFFEKADEAMLKGDKFNYHNAKFNGLAQSVKMMLDNNTLEVFKERLEGMKSLDDTSFSEQFGVDLKEITDKQKMIEDVIKSVEQIEKQYTNVKEFFNGHNYKGDTKDPLTNLINNQLFSKLFFASVNLDNIEKREKSIASELNTVTAKGVALKQLRDLAIEADKYTNDEDLKTNFPELYKQLYDETLGIDFKKFRKSIEDSYRNNYNEELEKFNKENPHLAPKVNELLADLNKLSSMRENFIDLYNKSVSEEEKLKLKNDVAGVLSKQQKQKEEFDKVNPFTPKQNGAIPGFGATEEQAKSLADIQQKFFSETDPDKLAELAAEAEASGLVEVDPEKVEARKVLVIEHIEVVNTQIQEQIAQFSNEASEKLIGVNNFLDSYCYANKQTNEQRVLFNQIINRLGNSFYDKIYIKISKPKRNEPGSVKSLNDKLDQVTSPIDIEIFVEGEVNSIASINWYGRYQSKKTGLPLDIAVMSNQEIDEYFNLPTYVTHDEFRDAYTKNKNFVNYLIDKLGKYDEISLTNAQVKDLTGIDVTTGQFIPLPYDVDKTKLSKFKHRLTKNRFGQPLIIDRYGFTEVDGKIVRLTSSEPISFQKALVDDDNNVLPEFDHLLKTINDLNKKGELSNRYITVIEDPGGTININGTRHSIMPLSPSRITDLNSLFNELFDKSKEIIDNKGISIEELDNFNQQINNKLFIANKKDSVIHLTLTTKGDLHFNLWTKNKPKTDIFIPIKDKTSFGEVISAFDAIYQEAKKSTYPEATNLVNNFDPITFKSFKQVIPDNQVEVASAKLSQDEILDMFESPYGEIVKFNQNIRFDFNNVPVVQPVKDPVVENSLEAKKADIERRDYLLSKDYKDFGWLTEQEKNDYLELQNNSKNKEERESAYIKLRELYNSKVDKEFIDKIEKIHWVRNLESLTSLLEKGKKIPFEISTEGYLNETFKSGWGNGIGLKLKGETLIASNEDLRSDNKYGSIEKGNFRKYSYGDATSVIINKDTFLPHAFLEFEERGKKYQGHNEFLLKNSKIEAIIIDETNEKLTEDFKSEVENIAIKFGIPIIINAKYDAELKALEQSLKETAKSETTSNQSEIDAKKADVERRRQEVERISKLPFQERIPALIKIGIIDSTISTQMGVRFPIIININGVKVPFYRSSNGTDGKTKGSWNPFFGFGKGINGDSWLIKGNSVQFKNNYNSRAIEEYSRLLDTVLNWDTEVDKVRGVKNHPFMNTLQQVSLEEFNEKVYNTKDLNIINGTSGETNPLIYVDNRIKEINAKYDAELAALQSNQASNVVSNQVETKPTTVGIPGFGATVDQATQTVVNDGSDLLDPFTIISDDVDDNIQTSLRTYTPNEINYAFKVTDIITKNLSKIKSWENNKSVSKETFWVKVQDLGIPKEQITLLKESEGNNIEEKLLDFVANYSYTVEINTAKEGIGEHKLSPHNFYDNFSQYKKDGKYYMSYADQDGKTGEYSQIEKEITKQEFEANEGSPTQHHSNLTVPGGTNYTENAHVIPALKGKVLPDIYPHHDKEFADGALNMYGWDRSDEQTKEGTGRIDEWDDDKNQRTVQNFVGGEATKTRRILEIQSKFQKWRLNFEHKGNKYQILENQPTDKPNVFEDHYLENGKRITGKEYNKIFKEFLDTPTSQEDAFIKLIAKQWETIMIKSIIQDSAKKGYEKVLFPTGDTASKVEGHTTLEEFKKQKEDRIKELEKEQIFHNRVLDDKFNNVQEIREELTGYVETVNKTLSEVKVQSNVKLQKIKTEIKQLKQELERVEGPEGFGALAPIYNFYENTVTNILNKTYGKVQDYGNTPIKNGVDNLFEENKELSKIGNKQLYSDYLDTIFPDSKVKDIVYHVNNTFNSRPGVSEVFESNPELANSVYEALGFEIPTTKLKGKKFYYGEPTFFDIATELTSGERSKLPSSILINKLLHGEFLPTIKDSQIILGLSEAGIWRPNLKKIEASGENKSTLAKKVGHELLHSVTNNIILSYQNLKGVIDFNDKYYKDFIKQGYVKPTELTKSQIEALDNLVRIRNKVVAYIEQNKDKIQKQDRGFGTYDYFIRTNYTESETDLHEFISEVFTNPELINILKEIPTEGKKSNLFKDFVDAIAKILGFTNTSILEDIIAYSEEAFFAQPQITPQQKQQAQQLYSQYLDTIFPDSKVKDIVYHGSFSDNIENFTTGFEGSASGGGEDNGGFYFIDNKETAEKYKQKATTNTGKIGKVYSIIINLKEGNGIDGEFLKDSKGNNEYVVYDGKQIHILGSKKDIEGFKEFVKESSKPKVPQITDEYGNTWNEVIIDLNRDLAPIVTKLDTKVETNLDNEAWSNYNEAMNNIRELLPDDISITTIDKLATSLFDKNELWGAFKEDTIYLGESVKLGVEYHEAFHAVFRKLLNDSEISNYLTIGKNELRTELAKSNKSFVQAVKEFKADPRNAKLVSRLTQQQIEDLVVEEFMADQFMSWKKNNKVKTGLAKLFQMIKDLFNIFKRNEDSLDALFKKIDGGQFRNASFQDNRFSKNRNVAAALIPTGNNNKLDSKQQTQLIDTVTAKILSGLVQQNKNAETDDTIILENVTELLNKVLKEEASIYDPRTKTGLTDEQKLFFTRQFVARDGVGNNPKAREIITKEVMKKLKSFDINEETTELEFIEDDLGNKSYVLNAENYGGFGQLSKEIKEYIASTVYTTTLNEAYGRKDLPNIEISLAVDAKKVYDGIVKATANSINQTQLINRLFGFAEHSEQAKHFINKFIKDVGYEKNEDGTFKINEEHRNRFQRVIKSFNLYSVDHRFIGMAISTAGAAQYKVHSANTQGMEFEQLKEWIIDFNDVYTDILEESNSVVKNRVVKAFRDIVNELTPTTRGEKVPKINSTQLNEKVEKIEKLLSTVQISLCKGYIKYLILSNNERAESLTKEQREFIDNYQDEFELDNKSAVDNFQQIGRLLEQGHNPFVKEEDLTEDESLERSGALTRLKQLAKDNAILDEKVSVTNFKNAENKSVYAYQQATFHLLKTIELRNESNALIRKRIKELLNDKKDADLNASKSQVEKFKLNNYLLNSTAFKAIQKGLSIIRADGSRVLKLQLGENGLEENTNVDKQEGVTFGKFTKRDFILYNYGLYTDRKVKVIDGKQIVLSPVIINIMESSSTLDMVNLPVINTYNKEGMTSEFKDIIYKEIERELARIQDFRNGEFKRVINNYTDGTLKADDFWKWKDLLRTELSDDQIERIKTGDVKLEDIRELINKATQKYFEQELQDHFDILTEEGVITKTVKGEGANTVVSYDNRLLDTRFEGKEIKGEKKLFSEKNLTANIAQVYLSNYVNTLSFNQLLNGDAALNGKTVIDFFKRARGANGAGSNFSLDYDGDLGYMTFDDPKFEVYSNGKQLTNDPNDQRVEGDRADAQSYGTSDMLKIILKSLGRYNKDVEKIINKLDSLNPNENKLTYKEQQTLSKSLAIANSYKIQGYDDMGQYLKTSINFIFAKDVMYIDRDGNIRPKTQNTSLYHLYKALKDNDLLFGGPLTFSKKAVYGVSKRIESTEANVNDRNTIGFSVYKQKINSRFLRLQMENPALKIEIKDPSQSQQLIDTEQNDSQEINLSELPSVKNIKQLKEVYQNALAQRSNAMMHIAERFLFKVKNNDRTPEFKNWINAMQESIAETNGSPQLIGLLNELKEGTFNLPSHYDKFEQYFNAHFSNAFLHKVPGYKTTLVSDWGRKILEDKNGKIITSRLYDTNPSYYEDLINSGEIKVRDLAYEKTEIDEKGNTRTYSEFMLPQHFAEQFNLKPGDEIPEQIAYMFGLRIPTQDKHSMLSLKLVDILPAEQGSNAVFPKEIIYLTGSDFDIDAFYIHRPDHYVDITNNIVRYGNTTDDSFVQYKTWQSNNNSLLNKLIKYYKEEQGFDRQVKTLESIYGGNQLKDEKKLLEADFLTQALKQLELPTTKEEYEEYKNKGLEFNIGIINNTLLECKIAFQTNDSITKEISKTPATVKALEDILNTLAEIKTGVRNSKLLDKKHDLFGLNAFAQALESNKAGKESIGAAVNSTQAYTFANKYGLSVNEEEVVVFNDQQLKEYGNTINEEDIRILDLLSTLTSSMTDNPTHGFVSKCNLTLGTLGIASDVVMRGGKLEDAIFMINTNFVKKYTNNVEGNNLETSIETRNGKSHYKKKIVKDLEDLIKKYDPSFVTPVDLESINSSDLRWMLENQDNIDGLTKEDKERMYKLQLNTLRTYLKLEEFNGNLISLSQILTLTKGLGTKHDQSDIILEHLDKLGITLRLSDKGTVLTTVKDGEVPFNNFDKAFMAHGLTNSNLKNLIKVLHNAQFVQITRTPQFISLLNIAKNNLKRYLTNREYTYNKVNKAILSHLSITAYRKYLKDNKQLELDLLSYVYTKDENNMYNYFVDLRRDELFKSNSFVRALKVSPPDENGFVEIKTTTFSNKNKGFEERLIDGFESLLTSSNPEHRKFAQALFFYEASKNAFQFKAGSFINLIAPVVFKSLATSNIAVNEVLRSNIVNEGSKSNVEITKSNYSRQEVKNNPDTAYVFTENTHSITAFPNTQGGGSAVIRPEANSFAIVTKKKYDYNTKENVDYSDTNADFKEFVNVNTRLIQELKDSGKSKIIFPQGFATDKAKMPTRFAEWLQKALLDNFGLVTELNSTKTGLISKNIKSKNQSNDFYSIFGLNKQELFIETLDLYFRDINNTNDLNYLNSALEGTALTRTANTLTFSLWTNTNYGNNTYNVNDSIEDIESRKPDVNSKKVGENHAHLKKLFDIDNSTGNSKYKFPLYFKNKVEGKEKVFRLVKVNNKDVSLQDLIDNPTGTIATYVELKHIGQRSKVLSYGKTPKENDSLNIVHTFSKAKRKAGQREFNEQGEQILGRIDDNTENINEIPFEAYEAELAMQSAMLSKTSYVSTDNSEEKQNKIKEEEKKQEEEGAKKKEECGGGPPKGFGSSMPNINDLPLD